MRKRDRIDRSPGKQGGATYVRRDAEGKFADDMRLGPSAWLST